MLESKAPGLELAVLFRRESRVRLESLTYMANCSVAP